MASPAEQMAAFISCPFQGWCRTAIEEHTTVSPEAMTENVTEALQNALNPDALGDFWSGRMFQKHLGKINEAGSAVVRSMVSGRPVTASRMVSRTDETGEDIRAYADGCERCDAGTKPIVFAPGERCEREKMAVKAWLNGKTLQWLLERQKQAEF